ncbi:sensor histidine kinase [Celerinatantimonas yamalensis]|uniref:histidine kinase n=1 Tax=Celerinatantimonas yamalensis TaxID=559956 RepID=A0ABW9G661_9GAMM
MVNWYQRQKLIHQIAWILLVGFALSFVLTLYLLSYDKSKRLNELSITAAMQRIASVAETLEQTPQRLHDSIIQASSSSDLRLSLSASAQVDQTKPPSAAEQRLLQSFYAKGIQKAHLLLVAQSQRPLMDLSEHHRSQSMMGANNSSMMDGMVRSRSRPRWGQHLQAQQYSATMNGSLLLSDGQWLNFSSGIENSITHWSPIVLIALIAMMSATVLVSLVIIRRALQPIRALGQAALSFARNKQVDEVSMNAPRDLVPTIQAFNTMQGQVTDYIKERTQLLAAISHDLRTPLTSLRLRLEFIENSDDKQQMLRTIQIMDKMLTETMRFAKNDANKEARQMTNVDSLLQTIVDEYDEKGIVIQYSAAASLSAAIPLLSVRRMTENLLNNAIQYAGDAAIISLSFCHDQHTLSIQVADDGVGIAADKLKEVVKPFTRLNAARDTQSSNIGLGLSITHSLATAYGGGLTLEPNVPQGLKASIVIALA